jgi:DNA-binding FadR family transcriptional regulator
MAKELGISRAPVREALLKLSFQGFVQSLPFKGFIVRRFNENLLLSIAKNIIGFSEAIRPRCRKENWPCRTTSMKR